MERRFVDCCKNIVGVYCFSARFCFCCVFCLFGGGGVVVGRGGVGGGGGWGGGGGGGGGQGHRVMAPVVLKRQGRVAQHT